MNTIIISMKKDCMSCSNEERIFVLDVKENLIEFKKIFENKLNSILNGFLEIQQELEHFASLITKEDYESKVVTQNLMNFEEIHKKMQKYYHDNFIIEIENNFFNFEEFFEGQSLYTYEIKDLAQWLKDKKEENKIKPKLNVI